MRKRKLLPTATLSVLLAVCAFVLWPRPRINRVTPENLERIVVGSGRSEVEAILGPPGDYTTKPFIEIGAYSIDMFAGSDEYELEWLEDTDSVTIVFDNTGHVRTWTQRLRFDLEEVMTPLETIQWRAKRQWQRWFP